MDVCARVYKVEQGEQPITYNTLSVEQRDRYRQKRTEEIKQLQSELYSKMCSDKGLVLPDCIKKSFQAEQTTIAEKWHLYKLKTKSCRRMSLYHAIVDFLMKSWLQIDDEHRQLGDTAGVIQYIQETARPMGEDRDQYVRDFDSIFPDPKLL